VSKTSRISTEARKLLRHPNCIVVKAKLKTRFKAKGSATTIGISFEIVFKKTVPKVIAITKYKKVHTGPKISDGGDQEGLIKSS